ncbi:GIY-YIG nuclease family protein [Mesorhizobium sp. M0050]|uniref:GIY-YIG nuclease family protein n=1 Tax=Mesorhizobium sp. M0050 TaxID=2956861 RepID=UPI00333BB16B
MELKRACRFFAFSLKKFLRLPPPLTWSGKEEHETSVYTIQCENFVKVGVARNVEARRLTLESRGPHPMFTLGSHLFPTLPYAMICERAAHQMLDKYRHRNEWFQTRPSIGVRAMKAAAEATNLLIARHVEAAQKTAANDNQQRSLIEAA